MTSQDYDSVARRPEARRARGPASDPHRDALLLDVDGTLVDIAPSPDAVEVPAALIALLSGLQKSYAGAVALVSGRTLANLDRLFRPWTFAAVGSHGAELRPWARAGMSVVTASPLPADVRHALADLAQDDPGLQIEDKSYTIALHYRRAPEQEAELRARILSVLQRLGRRDLQILRGKAVFEVKPRCFNKGIAVLALMNSSPFRGRRPIFLGDDVTDEDVFAVLPEFDGIGVSVGRRVPTVDWEFETPHQVRAWLRELAGAGTEIS